MCFRILTMGSFRRLGRDEALSRRFLVLQPSSCIIHLISRHCCDTHNIFAGGDTPQKLNKTKTEVEIKVSKKLQLPQKTHIFGTSRSNSDSNFTQPPKSPETTHRVTNISWWFDGSQLTRQTMFPFWPLVWSMAQATNTYTLHSNR